jgi:sugar/nucleoside kinase (ribokinase family)
MRDVLVVGDANPDLLLSGDVVPRFGQAEQDVDAAVALGGSGAIAAAALARLGVRVAIAAAVGDDDLGRLVAGRLAERGVGLAPLQRSAAPTGLSVHLLRGEDRAILTSAGAIADLDVDAACDAIAAGVGHVHLASLYLIPTLMTGGGRVLAAARAAGATVSIDTNYDPTGGFAVPEWLREADVLLPNAAEALALTGRPHDGDVQAAARDLASGGATVAVKLGADGALAVAGPGGDVVRVPAPAPPAVVDAVGAGDAFDAGFLRAQLDGRPPAERLALACAAGTLSVRDRGERGHATLEEALALAGLSDGPPS